MILVKTNGHFKLKNVWTIKTQQRETLLHLCRHSKVVLHKQQRCAVCDIYAYFGEGCGKFWALRDKDKNATS